MRNILVTGGSRGIGRAIVSRFARAGDTVWFTYHRGAAEARELIGELAGCPRPRAFPFAQGDWDSHTALMERLPGPVDVLVNNAAVGSRTVEMYSGPEAYQRDLAMLRINALGPLWLIQAVAAGMERRGGGKIVNICSVGGGITQFAGFAHSDGMSKAALAHLTRQLAAEWAHSPIDVFALCPGATDTPMFHASTLDGLGPGERAAVEAALPGGRLLSPGELAEIVFWLAGPHSAAMHGAVIDASLGLGSAPGLLSRKAEVS
ncbi:SDR family oxidoreductase [Streptosporangiaceae bacterium NEAU-GS5]|nr:SDR family oxidoreductase [Streptosporangiaceae bacterium NEAU-GS5]